MYSTYNGGKSAITERFMSSLKNMIYKHMAAVLQKVDVMLQMILFINIITHTIELLKWNLQMFNLILMLNTVLNLMKKILHSK